MAIILNLVPLIEKRKARLVLLERTLQNYLKARIEYCLVNQIASELDGKLGLDYDEWIVLHDKVYNFGDEYNVDFE